MVFAHSESDEPSGTSDEEEGESEEEEEVLKPKREQKRKPRQNASKKARGGGTAAVTAADDDEDEDEDNGVHDSSAASVSGMSSSLAAAPSRQAGDPTSLLHAALNGSELPSAVKEWLSRYQEDNNIGIMELINLILEVRSGWQSSPQLRELHSQEKMPFPHPTHSHTPKFNRRQAARKCQQRISISCR